MPLVSDDGTLELSAEQTYALDVLTEPEYSDINRVIYGGQVGGGKSVLISLWLNHMATTYPKTRYYIGREELKSLKESILVTFMDTMAEIGQAYIYQEHKNRILYPNGSTIHFVECAFYPSDPDFQSFGSTEFTAGAIEEGITVTKKAADILLTRTRYKHDVYGLSPKQLITCNPGPGWIKDDIVMPQIEKGRALRPTDIFISATLASNPNKAFAENYRKTVENNNTAYDRERLLDGNWNARDKTGAEFLKAFDQDTHVKFGLHQKYDPRQALHITFDENVNPYITCEVWQIHTEGEKRFVRQLYEICHEPPKNTRARACQSIIALFGGTHKGGMFIYGDATSRKGDTAKEHGENFFTDILEGLKQFNPVLRVPPKNPAVVSKGGFLNLIFEKDYRNISIQIDSDCKKSIDDYAYAKEDADGTIQKKRVTHEKTGVSYEKHGHHIDAMSYFICYAFLSDFNYYLSGGVKPQYDVGNDRNYEFRR